MRGVVPCSRKGRRLQKSRRFPFFYAGQLKDEDDLMEVSSGGAFWALSRRPL